MCVVRFSILFLLLLGIVCGGYRKSLTPEDPSMDPVLELLLQEELEFEASPAESESIDEGKKMRLVDKEWRCGNCKDFSRLLYSETTSVQLEDGAPAPASPREFQVGVVMEESISCVRVSGAATLSISVTDGGCNTPGVTFALRTRHNDDVITAHTIKLSVYA